MSALGFMLVGFGFFTAWAALQKQNVFDVLRAIVGAPITSRNATGARTDAATSGTGPTRTA